MCVDRKIAQSPAYEEQAPLVWLRFGAFITFMVLVVVLQELRASCQWSDFTFDKLLLGLAEEVIDNLSYEE